MIEEDREAVRELKKEMITDIQGKGQLVLTATRAEDNLGLIEHLEIINQGETITIEIIDINQDLLHIELVEDIIKSEVIQVSLNE